MSTFLIILFIAVFFIPFAYAANVQYKNTYLEFTGKNRSKERLGIIIMIVIFAIFLIGVAYYWISYNLRYIDQVN